ncbi:hypothetical protein GUITHDRAFT_142351 [Guillardia theta CCMP2712]|uniref:Methyltransferase small domain-containing protein n=1 Tax=Guillardia theta (strain CCMP2712) TaxID=905079 RepID=L1IYP8_GUITC|nr:hypothetical protein GUITHDRAFT_142351 [Guillardia theta CCMP2712]EKX40950.1 hypothetical protein GUITHDRAFT_142351 [Guillardia theta CCMP2712]|eukprot:XP_005827930.1 hypothetical protein GUITHDRAFT_142351 [Guillardia theta CCMP2712]
MLAIQTLTDVQLIHDKAEALSLDSLIPAVRKSPQEEAEEEEEGGWEEEEAEVVRDTLLQPNPCTLYKLQENGELLGMKDIVGGFRAFGQLVKLERVSPLIRRVAVGPATIQIAEAPAHDIGGSIWLSSIALCGWMAAGGRKELCGKVVLELGSGVGVAGVFAASCCSPARAILSDGTQSLVGLCQFNVELNGCAASCYRLDWGGDVVLGEEEKADVILAADCIYRTNADAFLRAVLDHLKPGGRLFLVNPPEENRTGIDEFIYKLWEHGDLEWKRIRVEHDGYVKSLLFIQFQREVLPSSSSNLQE